MTEVTLKGTPVQVAGEFPQAGQQAKPFSLVGADLADVELTAFVGKRKVLNIFPSIDTPTCATSVRKFNAQANALENTVVLCISADLPFAQKRFCGAEGLDNVINLSTMRGAEFLKDYQLRGTVHMRHVKGVIMIADILTKGVARAVFLQLIKLLDDYSVNSVAELTK